MGAGFHSSLGTESGASEGPPDQLRGFGWRDDGAVGYWAQVRPWQSLPIGGKRGYGVSGGGKGAVAAPGCREVHQEGKKQQEGGKKS